MWEFPKYLFVTNVRQVNDGDFPNFNSYMNQSNSDGVSSKFRQSVLHGTGIRLKNTCALHQHCKFVFTLHILYNFSQQATSTDWLLPVPRNTVLYTSNWHVNKNRFVKVPVQLIFKESGI